MLSKIITLIYYQSKPALPVTAHLCSCRQKTECLLNNEWLSKNLVYKAAVSQIYDETFNKTFKNDTTAILLHLEIKANRKVRKSLSTSGN